MFTEAEVKGWYASTPSEFTIAISPHEVAHDPATVNFFRRASAITFLTAPARSRGLNPAVSSSKVSKLLYFAGLGRPGKFGFSGCCRAISTASSSVLRKSDNTTELQEATPIRLPITVRKKIRQLFS